MQAELPPSNELRLRGGLRVDLETTPGGPLELKAEADHRVRIHMSAPVAGRCHLEPFVYTRGDVDIIPAGAAEAWEEDAPSAFLLLRVPPALLRSAAADMGLDPDRAGVAPRHQFRDPRIEHIAWALDAERRADSPNGLLYTESLGLALAAHLLGRYPADVPSSFGLSKPQLRRLTTFIDEHLDQDLSLARLAGVAGGSASHLKTLFKRSTGLAVHQFVVRRRVERARHLLAQGDLPVSQVALEVGFAHQSHLALWMRRLLGTTPTVVMRGRRHMTTTGRRGERATTIDVIG